MSIHPHRTPSRRLAPGSWRPGRWLLACALVAWMLATLAPGVSRMWQHLQGPRIAAQQGWVEVCTAHGMDWVKPDGSLVHQSPTDPTATLDACGHCALALDRFAAPPVPQFAWQGLTLQPTQPGDRETLPAIRGAAATRFARGPPHTA